MDAAERLGNAAYQRDDIAIAAAMEATSAAAACVAAQPTVDRPTPVLRNLASVKPSEISWLSPLRLARGELTLLAGDPGVGKTWIALDITARLTRGKAFPGGAAAPVHPLNVILMADENREATSIARLRMLGGDVTRVNCCTEMTTARGLTDLRLTDIDVLEQAITSRNAELLVIDPVNSYIAGADSYNDVEMRGVLNPLVKLARRASIAILTLMHLSKNVRRQPLHRILGSVAYIGVARIVLLAMKDPKRRHAGLLFSPKNNLAEEAEPLTYILGKRLTWGAAPADFDGELLLSASPVGTDALDHSANEFLGALLNDPRETWPLKAEVTVEKARKVGISPSSLQRARSVFGITTRKKGFGPRAEWLWHRPKIAPSPRRK